MTMQTEKTTKIGFIGGGQMGEALIRGIIQSGLYAAGDILVAVPRPCNSQGILPAKGNGFVGLQEGAYCGHDFVMSKIGRASCRERV